MKEHITSQTTPTARTHKCARFCGVISLMDKKEIKHRCEKNQYKDADINYEKINQVDWGWVLSQWQIVDEIDIEDGYEGAKGSRMCSHHLLINHCPFCGENLENIEQSTW